MIKFEEDQHYGYKERTIKNASADVTIAIAIDFNTAGERLTKNADELVYMFLLNVVNSPDLKVKISAIRTGGQTGIDEAGAKAGVRLGIPTSILAPKCWRFRNEKGEDISDENLFKNRFMNI